MKVQVYKSYGVLAHEKKPFYSVSAPASDIFDLVSIDIPFPTWRNYMDEIGVTIDGADYLLSQVLTNWGDKPAFMWVDSHGKHHRVLEESADV